MIRFCLAAVCAMVWLAVTPAAKAQSVRVQAGEHEGFTRIVLSLPGAIDWRLGRTAEGYELRLPGPPPRFDLSEVFSVIPRTRLTTIWADPGTGHLRLGLGCACHAIPFEFQDNFLVIDLRDGPPPAESSFEATLDGEALAKLAGNPATGPRPRTRPALASGPRPGPRAGAVLPAIGPVATLWTLAIPAAPQPAVPPQPGPRARQPTVPPDLGALRMALLAELGRAASAGIIDTRNPIFPPEGPDQTAAGPLSGAGAHMTIGEVPGVVAWSANTSAQALTAAGGTCLTDDRFDLLAWTDGRTFGEQLGAARGALLGEFDRADTARVRALARLYLYHGFGAETVNLLATYPSGPQDDAIWRAMAEIMDNGVARPGNPLAAEAACPGRVALWSALARPAIRKGDGTDSGAVTIAFSELPVHLRRLLGPGLAEKFLAAGDLTTAGRLRDAIWRAPGNPGPAARMMDGQIARARGDLGAAEATFAEVSREGGPTAVRAAIALVDARLALGETLDPGMAIELAALRRENRGGTLEAPLFRAEMLARASSGDFGAAFGMAAGADLAATADLWRLLATAGSPTDLLDHAILADAAVLPAVDGLTRERIGNRLLDLGFPDDALMWLPPANIVQVAEAELARGDARAALRTLAGEPGAAAERLRAAALAQLGDQAAAALAYGAAGDESARLAALWRAGDWPAGAAADPEPRQAVLEGLAPAPGETGGGPLARGRMLVEDSAATRTSIQRLLASTPDPASP